MGLLMSIVPTLLLVFTVTNGRLVYNFDDEVEEDSYGRFPRGVGEEENILQEFEDTVIPPISSSSSMTTITDDCTDIQAPDNGDVSVDCSPYSGDGFCIVNFECPYPYFISGTSNNYLSYNCYPGQDVGVIQTPVCEHMTCDLFIIYFGVYLGGYNEGDSGNITCDQNFELSAEHDGSIECLNQTWVPFIPTCIFVDCGDPVIPVNGSADYNCTDAGCIAMFSCEEGFIPVPGWQVECLENYSWEFEFVCLDEANETDSYGSLTFGDVIPFRFELKDAMQAYLTTYFRSFLGDDLIGVVVTLDNNTNTFNYTVVINDNENATQALAVAQAGLSQPSFVILLGQRLDIVQASVLGFDVNLNTSACDIYENVYQGSCNENETCTVEDNSIVCTPEDEIEATTVPPDELDDPNNLPVIVGLTVGIPVFALCIAGTMYCCCLCCRAAGAEEDEEGDIAHWHIGWLPRYQNIPVRINTKSAFYGYLYNQGLDTTIGTSETDPNTVSGSSFTLELPHPDTGETYEANFSWDNLFYPISYQYHLTEGEADGAGDAGGDGDELPPE